MEGYIGRGPEKRSFCPHGAWGWQGGRWNCSGSPAWKLFRSPPFGFLWRFHCIDMIN